MREKERAREVRRGRETGEHTSAAPLTYWACPPIRVGFCSEEDMLDLRRLDDKER
jgi:hypothetical protein